jgi:protocatechuate 3,4-dioxygenase beta subunit
MSTKWTRRDLIENCITRGLLVAGASSLTQAQLFSLWAETTIPSGKPTPTEVLGPFFKKGAPDTRAMRAAGAAGFPLRITGKVYNVKGEKVQGAKVDLWHADEVGLYDLEGYKYRSKLSLENTTEYAVDTIMPGHYDDRPAQHVHYMISAPGHRTLITQLYFATDPFFEGDPDKHVNKRNIVANRELIRPVLLYEKVCAPSAAVSFDIVLEKL